MAVLVKKVYISSINIVICEHRYVLIYASSVLCLKNTVLKYCTFSIYQEQKHITQKHIKSSCGWTWLQYKKRSLVTTKYISANTNRYAKLYVRRYQLTHVSVWSLTIQYYILYTHTVYYKIYL